MSSFSEFQTTGPETRKLLGPKRRVLVRGTVRSPRIADREPWRRDRIAGEDLSDRIAGAAEDLSDRIAGAAEVCRTSTMEGVVDEDCDLEGDTLTDGKPVEMISRQHRSDMVDIPPV